MNRPDGAAPNAAPDPVTWVAPRAIEGDQVRLEPLGRRHAAGLAVVGVDPEIWTFMPCPPDIVAFIDRAALEQEEGQRVAFAIIDRHSGTAIGSTSFLDVQPLHRRVEIGWTWIGRAYWRTAINTETKLLLLTHAFDRMGAERVALKTDGRNVRSQAAIARLGAQREGVLRRHMRLPDGFIRDTVYYSILREEWPLVREGLRQRLGASG